MAITVPLACFHEHFQLDFIHLYQVTSNLLGNQRSAIAMLRIVIIIQSPQIVNKRKVLDHATIGSCLLSQHQAIVTNSRPVGGTMYAIPIKPELLASVRDKLFRYQCLQSCYSLSINFQTIPIWIIGAI